MDKIGQCYTCKQEIKHDEPYYIISGGNQIQHHIICCFKYHGTCDHCKQTCMSLIQCTSWVSLIFDSLKVYVKLSSTGNYAIIENILRKELGGLPPCWDMLEREKIEKIPYHHPKCKHHIAPPLIKR